MVQNVRGKSGSGGPFIPFINEKGDGLACLKWIEAQEWCNGAIGIWGESYIAYCGLVLARVQHRLEELVLRWTDKEVLTQLEHFQNEFILHEGRIDEFLEGIESHEHRIAGQSMAGDDSMDRAMVHRHLEFRDEMETQREMFHNLKKEFFKFLTKYL